MGQGEGEEVGLAPQELGGSAEGYGSGGPSSARTWGGGEQHRGQRQHQHRAREGAATPGPSHGARARREASRAEGKGLSPPSTRQGRRGVLARAALPVADAAVVGASRLGGDAFPADGDAGDIVLGLHTGQTRGYHHAVPCSSCSAPPLPPLPALPSLQEPSGCSRCSQRPAACRCPPVGGGRVRW